MNAFNRFMDKKRNILVTGAHRSGSTWVGEVIATARGVNYIHEPFNIFLHEDTIFDKWFEYIPGHSDNSQLKVVSYINRFVNLSFKDAVKNIMEVKSYQKRYSILKNYVKLRLSNRQLIKDPIAVMSAEWMAKMFNLDVLVIARHPAAFSASLKMKDWQFDFNWFMAQERLMNDYLYPFKEDIQKQIKNRGDIIDQAILLWNCIYHVVHVYQKKYREDWIFIRHEDVSMNPIKEFKNIFNSLNLNWDGKVEKTILHSTLEVNSSEYHLSAKENILSWKRRLSPLEIERIKEGTKSISKYFYNEDEW